MVAALAGRRSTRVCHVASGVDIVVAQGYEAGGHTGEIASMVLVPEIVDAVGPDVPVLGAGGIGSGRQIAASLALGAQGVWTGSIWLGTEEYRRPARNRAGRGVPGGDVRPTRCAPGSTPASRPGCSRPVDRGVGGRGRADAAADAAAEPARRRGAQPDERAGDPTWCRCRSARSSAG